MNFRKWDSVEFDRVPRWLSESSISDGAIRIWLRLHALCVAGGEAFCIASTSDLMDGIDRTDRWYRDRIRELETVGAVTREKAGRSWRFRLWPHRKPDSGTLIPESSHHNSGIDVPHRNAGSAMAWGEGGSVSFGNGNAREKQEIEKEREKTRAGASLYPGSESSKRPAAKKRTATKYPQWFESWWSNLPVTVRDSKGGALKLLDGMEAGFRQRVMESGAQYGAMAASNPDGSWRGIVVWMNAADYDNDPEAWLARAMKGGNGSNGHKRGAPKVSAGYRLREDEF